MTGFRIYQCPRCELRFTSSSEMESHLADDHRPRADLDDQGPAAKASAPPPQPHAPPQPVESAAEPARAGPAEPRQRHWIAVVAAAAGLAVLVLLIVLVSTPATLISAALLVGLVAFYGWRASIRAGPRRRET